MKKTINFSLILCALLFRVNAQVVLHEPFNAPFNPAAAGWDVQNLSSPVGTTSWFQGNVFNALAGGPTDYFAVNFNSTSGIGTNNTISNWLITPTVNIVNGAVVQFVTRTTENPTFADRLQLYYSTAGNGNNVGTTAGTATNTAGTFTNILVDLNPSQLSMGYPGFWIVMTATLTGITTPTVGRLAFRYYLTSAGASGINGNYVGIDEFRYSMPCNFSPTWMGWTSPVCTGNPVNLQIIGNASTISSYNWFTGANTNTTSFTPTTPGVISCYVVKETTPGCVDLEISIMNVLASPTVSIAQDPVGNICSGSTITITASGANTYTYELSPTSSSTINPISLNIPTVSSLSNFSVVLGGKSVNNCVHTQTIQLAVNPNPTVTATGTTAVLCIGNTATLGVTGASTYTWSGAGSSTMNPYTYTASAPAGVRNFTVRGQSVEGCLSAGTVVTLTISNCTGLDELSGGREIVVYPNPFSARLYFDSFSGSVKVYNELGQQVMVHEADKIEEINTAGLPSGVYLLQVTTSSGERVNRRMIKQ